VAFRDVLQRAGVTADAVEAATPGQAVAGRHFHVDEDVGEGPQRAAAAGTAARGRRLMQEQDAAGPVADHAQLAECLPQRTGVVLRGRQKGRVPAAGGKRPRWLAGGGEPPGLSRQSCHGLLRLGGCGGAAGRKRQRRSGRRGQRRLQPFPAHVHEAAEQLDVHPGRRPRRRVPLHAYGEPAVGAGLDDLDDAVEGAGAHLEAAGHAVDPPAVLTVDDDLTPAVEARQPGAGQDVDGVAQPLLGRMAVLQGVGQLARQVDVQGAAARQVEDAYSRFEPNSCALRFATPPQVSHLRQPAEATSAEVSAGTCGATTPAASSLVARSSEAEWLGLAGWPFHAGLVRGKNRIAGQS
jgi:hypothetical protein